MSARKRRRRWAVIAVVVLLAAGGATVLVVYDRRGATAPAAATGLPPATATVTRATLAETERLDGTLGYGPATQLINRLPGTVTEVAAPGAVVERGQVLYRVDQRPVVLLYGPVPAYRALQADTTGADVRQLEENLQGLGYGGFTVDDRYTAATGRAVRTWQRDLGLEQTGVVDLGGAVFLPAAVRVAQISTQPGQSARPDGPVLTYTGTAKVVTAEVETDKLPLLAPGTRVRVALPGAAPVAAEVAGVSTVATAADGQDESAGQNGTPAPGPATATFTATFTLADQAATGTLDGAPVSVEVVGRSRENVLTVPIAALLALREGGYGVQLVTGGTARIVAVRTGLFARGLVEVSGDGIVEGAVVGVPAP